MLAVVTKGSRRIAMRVGLAPRQPMLVSRALGRCWELEAVCAIALRPSHHVRRYSETPPAHRSVLSHDETLKTREGVLVAYRRRGRLILRWQGGWAAWASLRNACPRL